MPLRLNELIVTAQSFYHLAPSHFEHSKHLRISSKSGNNLPIIRFFFLISVPIADSAADDANSVSSLSTIRLSQFWAAGLTRSPRYSQQVSRNEKVTETYRNCIVQSYFKLLFTFLLTRVGVSCCHLHMTFVAPK